MAELEPWSDGQIIEMHNRAFHRPPTVAQMAMYREIRDAWQADRDMLLQRNNSDRENAMDILREWERITGQARHYMEEALDINTELEERARQLAWDNEKLKARVEALTEPTANTAEQQPVPISAGTLAAIECLLDGGGDGCRNIVRVWLDRAWADYNAQHP